MGRNEAKDNRRRQVKMDGVWILYGLGTGERSPGAAKGSLLKAIEVY